MEQYPRHTTNVMVAFFVIILSLLGVYFRVWLNYLNPQPIIGDQLAYFLFAQGIKEHGLYAYITRTYGYPIFLSLFFPLAQATPVLTILQSVIDVGTGILLFFLARSMFRNQAYAFTTLFLYAFNPFTAAYVGSVLSETWFSFVLALSFILLFRNTRTLFLWFHLLWMGILGYVSQIRPPFVLLSGLYVSVWFVYMRARVRDQHFLSYLIVSTVVFFLPFVYSVIGNYVYFHKITPFAVANRLGEELAEGIAIDRQKGPWLDVPQGEALDELLRFIDPTNPDETFQKEQTRALLAYWWHRVKDRPLDYYGMIQRRHVYVWDKTHIFPYVQTFLPTPMTYLRMYNALFVLFGVLGAIRFWMHADRRNEWVGVYVIILIVFITILHASKFTEERYSIPAYPFLILFFPHGVGALLRYMQMLFRRARDLIPS